MPTSQPFELFPRGSSQATALPDPTAIDPAKLIEGFFAIMRDWRASNGESRAILGLPAERTFQNWKKGDVKALPHDTIRRIGYIAGIYKALAILYSDPSQALRWIRSPNAHFGGQTPIDRMTAGDVTDLAQVRTYLDAARAPWS